jgi:PKD repeat protein
MNRITKLLSAAFLATTIFTPLMSQDLLPCATTEMVQKLFNANPQLKQQYIAAEAARSMEDKAAFANGYKEGDGKSMVPIYTIPVVFHILHLGGPENISDAQVIDEMRILNEDYRKLNPDITAVVPSFVSVAADCEIQFRLAQKDPAGNCTNGIDRIYSSLTNSADDASKLNDWPHDKYLNVWVVKTIGLAGAAGYAYLPGMSAPDVDGILILSTYIGSIGTGSVTRSRALTHEVGHYLNLSHTWGGTNNPGVACGDDGVSDTPDTEGHTACLLTDAVCTSGVIENVQNYMEYAYCSNMFTTGQKNRMRTALTSTTGFGAISKRYKLWTTTNLAATGVSTASVLCLADFQSNKTTNSVCQGDSLTFTDLSWNGNPTAWTWTFTGGTPATSTDSMPTIVYNTPGLYNVSLTVSNGSGSVSATKTGYITVYPNTATYTAPFYSEGFEGSAIPNVDWNVNNLNAGTNTWVQTTTAAATGTKSVRIVNASTYDGNVDELISPPIDITAISGSAPTLLFKVAHAQKTATSSDKLQVFVSTNCAQTWTLRKSITGALLSTAGVVSSGSFTPTAAQWATQTVSLASFTSATSLFVMFKFTSNGGNNIYIDDINILGSVGIADELANQLNFNVYPNPAEENTIINFYLPNNEKTDVVITDVLGRTVSAIYSGNLTAGDHQFSIAEKAKLSAGIYFVKLTVGAQAFTKKLIVN